MLIVVKRKNFNLEELNVIKGSRTACWTITAPVGPFREGIVARPGGKREKKIDRPSHGPLRQGPTNRVSHHTAVCCCGATIGGLRKRLFRFTQSYPRSAGRADLGRTRKMFQILCPYMQIYRFQAPAGFSKLSRLSQSSLTRATDALSTYTDIQALPTPRSQSYPTPSTKSGSATRVGALLAYLIIYYILYTISRHLVSAAGGNLGRARTFSRTTSADADIQALYIHTETISANADIQALYLYGDTISANADAVDTASRASH